VDEAAPLATLERELEGHKGWIHGLTVSPDSTWAASASKDNTVKLWNLADSRCRVTLEGHTGRVNCVAITPDGRRVVSGGDDHTIWLWDAADGRLLAQWQASEHSVMSIVPLADNRLLLSCGAGNDPVVKLWDMHTQQCLATFEGHTDAVTSLALSRDEKHLVSASYDKTLRLWDVTSGQCLAVLKGHTSDVNCVQISPDGRHALSGSDDTTIKLWDLHHHTCLGSLEGHQNKVHSIALSPDGGWLASTGFTDGTVRLWDWRASTCVHVIENEDKGFPISVAFSPDGARLLVGTVDDPIYVYRLSRIHYAHCHMQLSACFDNAPPARRYRNAKVVLLGKGTVGKTSLAHRLIDDEYVVKDRTHGMNVWRLELPEVAASPAPSPHGGRLGWGQDQTATALSDHPLPASPTGGGDHGAATEQEEEREALLWDLAGQEDYRLIHQLFLEETALALLLVNPQKDDPFAEAGDWLKTLQTAARNGQAREAARLLLFSQIDVGGMKVSDGKIQRFCEQYGFAGWLPTSAKSGENCSDAAAGGPSRLKQLIAQAIPWERLPWTSTPRLLAQLKNTVMDLRDAADIRLLRFAELAQRLEQALPEESFGEAEVRTAVTLLANHGLAQPLKFGDLVLLRPDLLNGYAGAVIRAARAHRDEIGSVAEAEVYGEGFDFTGVERLLRPDEELLLRALVQTLLDNALCIAEETTQGRHLVFPSQYRRRARHSPPPGGVRFLYLLRRMAERLHHPGGAAVVQQRVRPPGAVAQRGGVPDQQEPLLGPENRQPPGRGRSHDQRVFRCAGGRRAESGIHRIHPPPPGPLRQRSTARPALRVPGVRQAGTGLGGGAPAAGGEKGFHLLPRLR
jgi:GTPase SAR1 family protein